MSQQGFRDTQVIYGEGLAHENYQNISSFCYSYSWNIEIDRRTRLDRPERGIVGWFFMGKETTVSKQNFKPHLPFI